MRNVVFKCDTCGYLAEGNDSHIEKAKAHTLQLNHYGSKGWCNGKFEFYTIVNTISDRYNQLKLDNIKKSTCKGCKLKPCLETPEMLQMCQFEAFEYRLRSGHYNIASGEGMGDFAEDIKGVIIDGTSVHVEDIKRLFVARDDTYSLYNPEDFGKEKQRAPESNQPPTDDVILRCLMGDITIGFRPFDPETNLCKWICYDIDKHSCQGTIYESNPRNAVDAINKLLKDWYNLTGHIELSGSPDSHHSWVFIEPTDYEIVKKFDELFKSRCDPLINQAICKRVEKGDGRMIKMPYAINLKNGVRSKFLGDLSIIQPEKLPFLK